MDSNLVSKQSVVANARRFFARLGLVHIEYHSIVTAWSPHRRIWETRRFFVCNLAGAY